MGIPTAQITALYGLVESTGANRIVKGARIEHVCGDPALGPDKDHAYGQRIVMTAIHALQTPVTGPTVFDPAEFVPAGEVSHAS